MRLKYQQTECGGFITDPVSFAVEGPTPIQCLALVEQELAKMDLADGGLCEDPAFDAGDCIKALDAGRPYKRRDFSTPEEDFTLTPE